MGEGQGEESKWGRKGKCGPTVISLGEKEREKGKGEVKTETKR